MSEDSRGQPPIRVEGDGRTIKKQKRGFMADSNEEGNIRLQDSEMDEALEDGIRSKVDAPNAWTAGDLQSRLQQKPVVKIYYTGEGEKDEWDEMAVETKHPSIKLPNVPQVAVSKEELKKLYAPLRRALVVKMLGKKVGFNNLRQRIRTLWQIPELELTYLDNDFYMVRFRSKDEYERVLHGGPWIILGHYLTIQKWHPNFDPDTTNITKTLTWVRLPKLPIAFFNEELLAKLGKVLGRVIQIDKHTAESLRGRFARICIEIDLTKPLKPYMYINERLQHIEYEGLHLVCFQCGSYGHRKETCGGNEKQAAPDKTHGQQGQTETGPTVTSQNQEKEVDETNYGPWMLAPARARRSTKEVTVGEGITNKESFTNGEIPRISHYYFQREAVWKKYQL